MIVAGLDIGNGYVKGLVKNMETDQKAMQVDMPSASSIITNSNDVRIIDAANIQRIMDDMFNEIECSIDSPLVGNSGTHTYIGRRAVQAGKSIQEFNLCDSRHSKSENELSSRLIFAILAAKVLKDFYNSNKKLPEDPISADIHLALALPIAEFKARRDTVITDYKSSIHTVTIHNFEKDIVVKLSIVDVQVAPEGASAHLAIVSKGPAFMNKLIEDMESRGLKMPEGITASDIVSAGGIVGIDIGEGTVNFPIYNDFVFNPDISSTLNKGYGGVLDEAATNLARNGRPEGASRKVLSEFIETAKNKPMKRAQYNAVMQTVNPEIDIFVEEIISHFISVLDRAGAFIEVVYVYGGGATPVKDVLYPRLIKAIQNCFGEEAFVPVLYLDSSYSRYLNRDGLFLIGSRDDKSIEKLD